MKRAFLFLLATVTAVGLSGCFHHNTCGPRSGGILGGCQRGQPAVCDSGPPTGQVTYPYYTLHGPRDFLATSPRSIGP